jgi:hypothetical protein
MTWVCDVEVFGWFGIYVSADMSEGTDVVFLVVLSGNDVAGR